MSPSKHRSRPRSSSLRSWARFFLAPARVFPHSLLLFLATVLLAGCQGPGRGSGDPGSVSGDVESLTGAVQAEITVPAMDQELDSIVQYDRLSGSPGENAAVAYLARTLEAEGISCTIDTFPAWISDPVSARVEVPGSNFAPEAITISGSGNARNLLARVVDVGTLADLPNLLTETGERVVLDASGPAGSTRQPTIPDLTGKIALVTGQPRPEPVLQLALMGAVGAVFVNPEERLNDLTTTSVWGSPSLRSYHRIPALPVAEIKKSDGDQLRSMMAGGWVELRMSTETREGWKPLQLLVARISGPAPESPYVLAGGHLDSWHFGGTDNGGANVAMLELVRAFHRHRQMMRRGLVMAWWPGHSNGRYAGSTWYVDQHFDELRRRALAYLNFEGLGQMKAKRFGAAASAGFSELAREVVRSETGEEIRPYIPGRNSDQSFNGVGLPLLQFNHSRLAEDGGYWWWHTPDDTRDKVDAQVLKVDTDLYAAALARLLAAPVFPMDLAAPVERLGAVLQERQETAGAHLDLGEAMERQERLLATLLTLDERLGEMGAGGADDPDAPGDASSSGERFPSRISPLELDPALVAILRPVHRILYTLQGPYHPDPALSMGELPGLNAVAMLAANDPGTDRYQMARTTLLRELARTLEAMEESEARARALLDRMPSSP